nr:unnamed protein product [Spirometra erinaceieuropaei]
MDPLSLVVEQCADSEHTFAFQNAKILGRDNDRVARETIEVWHTKTTSMNHCVALPAAYRALRTQLNELKSKREVRPSVNPNTGETTTDLHVATPQIGPDEGTVINTVVSTTDPADGEKHGQRDAIKNNNPGRRLRSTRMRATATNVQMPPPTRDRQSGSSHPSRRLQRRALSVCGAGSHVLWRIGQKQEVRLNDSKLLDTKTTEQTGRRKSELPLPLSMHTDDRSQPKPNMSTISETIRLAPGVSLWDGTNLFTNRPQVHSEGQSC